MERTKRLGALFAAALVLAAAAFLFSLSVGRYPITWTGLWDDPYTARVFFTLRLPRACMALSAGFALGVAGSVYQCVFQNPLASPDIIGVASGASAGAAMAVLLFGGGVAVTALWAFAGGFLAVLAALALSALSSRRGIANLVLSGIVVNALAQSVLMLMKLAADPEKELASIEFWTMGSFADITLSKLMGTLPWILLGLAGLFALRRQIVLLGLDEDDAQMLGVPVKYMRPAILMLATLATGAVISVTGLIAFIGLLAPHIARLLTRNGRFSTAVLAGLCGGILMLLSDVLARSIGDSEVPISIITSMLGAPFLFWLMCGKEDLHG